MKKQISLLLVTVVLNLSNGAQAANLSSTRRALTPLFRQAGQTVSQGRSGLSQGAINAARQFSTQPTVPLTNPAIRTSELLSKAGTMPTRALTTSSTGWNSEQMRSDYGWWKQIKDSSTARWIASLFAGGALASGIYNAKPVLAEEEAKNPHFEELLKSEYGPTPSMVRLNNERLFNAVYNDDTNMFLDAIERGADINAKDEWGKTPLIKAAEAGRVNMVLALLQAGANVHATTKAGNTALDIAKMYFYNFRYRDHSNDLKIIRILEESMALKNSH